MSRYRSRLLTRRAFLKLTGTGLAAAGMSPLLQACGPAVRSRLPTGQTLNFWWNGEIPGPRPVQKWIDETTALYAAKTENTIQATLIEDAVANFYDASAVKAAPDIMYLWNGISHMEAVWQDYLEPLENFFSAEEISATRPTSQSVFQGKTYRLGWIAADMLFLYNKEMFDTAGLDGNTAPKTWDQLLHACDKLKTKGITPIVGGLRGGGFDVHYTAHGLAQNLDTQVDALNLIIGNLDWREPRYYEHWSRLKELWDAGFINNDFAVVDAWPGMQLFAGGKGAMTAISDVVLDDIRTLMGGSEKIGLMTFPVFGNGKMAGKPVTDCQGLGISSQSKNKPVAADFLRFARSPDRLESIWKLAKLIPYDSSFDSELIDDSLTRELRSRWVEGNHVPFIGNLIPAFVLAYGTAVSTNKIIEGQFTAEQAGQNAFDVTQEWRRRKPTLVEKYSIWTKDLET